MGEFSQTDVQYIHHPSQDTQHPCHPREPPVPSTVRPHSLPPQAALVRFTSPEMASLCGVTQSVPGRLAPMSTQA